MSVVASFKGMVRDSCGHILALSRATAPAVRLKQRLSVVTFHRVLTEQQRRSYALPGLAVTPDELDAHLDFATRHFRCMSLDSALNLWASNHACGQPLLAITFDDGQLDNYQNALPVLERHRVTATFYIPSRILDDQTPLWHDVMATSIAQLTSHLGDESIVHGLSWRAEASALIADLQPSQHSTDSTMGIELEAALETTKHWNPAQRDEWNRRAQSLLLPPDQQCWDGFLKVEQMLDLIARGHEIGSHSHSHPLLPQCTDEELLSEIVGSKQRLESTLGAPITTFCYPNGSSDQRSVALVRAAGYRAAVTTVWGSNSAGSDPYLLQRFDMNARHAQDRKGRFSEARLAWRMSGLYPGLKGAMQNAYSGSSS